MFGNYKLQANFQYYYLFIVMLIFKPIPLHILGSTVTSQPSIQIDGDDGPTEIFRLWTDSELNAKLPHSHYTGSPSSPHLPTRC